MEQVMLDMIPTGAKAVCHVSQYDIGRTIRFNLISGGAAYTLSGTETVKVYIKKPDGTTAERNIANTSSTYVDWVTGEGDCDQAGECECELVITSGTTVIGSKNFTVKIEEDPYNDQGVVTETAGPAVIATFTTNVVDLLQEVKCSINPIQDLHGYDYPWPAGGGKNKFDKTAVTNGYLINGSGNQVSYAGWNISDFIPVSEGTSLYLNGLTTHPNTNQDNYMLFDESKTKIGYANVLTSQYPWTVPAGTKYVKFSLNNSDLNTAMFATSEGEYEPYSNDCPISGFTEMKIIRSGVNLFDGSKVTTTHPSNWGVTFENNNLTIEHKTAYSTGVPSIDFNLFGTFTISFTATQNYKCSLYENGSYKQILNNGTQFTTTPGNTYSIIFGADDNTTNVFSNIQIETGNTATTYHPAEIIEKTIHLGQTVYRARINITTGQGIIDMAGVTDLSQLDWTKYDVGGNNLYRSEELNIKKTGTQYDLPDLLCSTYPVVRQAERRNMTMSMPTTSNHVDIINNNYSNASDFKASLAGKQMAYEIATPVTIQLTPEQIEALLGVNNVWHDGNGNTEVKYLYNA